MNENDYLQFRERIIENIRLALGNVEDNPLMENYNARNLECYLRSLEILERMRRKNG